MERRKAEQEEGAELISPLVHSACCRRRVLCCVLECSRLVAVRWGELVPASGLLLPPARPAGWYRGRLIRGSSVELVWLVSDQCVDVCKECIVWACVIPAIVV